MFNNCKSLHHLPQTNSSPSPSSLAMNPNPSPCISSHNSLRQPPEVLMRMATTRCRPITSPPLTPPTAHLRQLEDYNGDSQSVEGLSEDSNTRQGLTENPLESMTPSARIAHTYRMMQSRESEGLDARAAMQFVTSEIEDPFQDPDKELRKREQLRLRVCEMLCSVPPRIIERKSNELTDEARQECEAHAILYHHRRIAHTIVLDSRCPDLAPHIVITPPDDSMESPRVAQNNVVGLQTAGNLCVPPFYMSTCRLPTYYEWMTMFYPCPAPQPDDSEHHSYSYFSLSLFKEYSLSTAHERASLRNHAALFTTNRLLIRSAAISASEEAVEICKRYTPTFIQLVDDAFKNQAEQRILSPQCVFNRSFFRGKEDFQFTYEERVTQLRLAFTSTSIIAQEWRTIYDSQIYLDSIDRRFQWRWTDPAEPILQHLGTWSANAIVIHSDFPCFAPHIVISFAESNGPRPTKTYDSNFLSVEHGRCPHSAQVDVSNDDDSNIRPGPNPHIDERCSSDYTSDTDSLSTLGTKELLRAGGEFFLSLDDTDEEDITNHWHYQSYSQDITSLYNNHSSSGGKPTHVKSEHSSNPIFFIYDDEEEDGLPEYDEWYTSWATSRMQGDEQPR